MLMFSRFGRRGFAALMMISAAALAHGGEDGQVEDVQAFLRRLTEVLQNDTRPVPNVVPNYGVTLGDHLPLPLEYSAIGLIAAALQDVREQAVIDPAHFEAKDASAEGWFGHFRTRAKNFVRGTRGLLARFPAAWAGASGNLRATIDDLSLQLAHLVGVRAPSAAGHWLETSIAIMKELPLEISAWAYQGYREFGLLYVGVIAGTYPPYFIATEGIEHFILQLPPGAACAQIQLGYFAVVGSAMVPLAAVCANLIVNPEDPSAHSRLRNAPRNLWQTARDFLSERALGAQLKVVSLKQLNDHLPLFDADRVRRLDFEGSDEVLLAKLAGHPFFWPVVELLIQKNRYPLYPFNHKNDSFVRTLADQLGVIMGTRGPEEADLELQKFTRRMIVYQQGALLRWMLKLNLGVVQELRERGELPYFSRYLPLKGRLGDLGRVVRSYTGLLKYWVNHPDELTDPAGRQAQMKNLLMGGILRAFELLNNYYQDMTPVNLARLNQHSDRLVSDFLHLESGRRSASDCELKIFAPASAL